MTPCDEYEEFLAGFSSDDIPRTLFLHVASCPACAKAAAAHAAIVDGLRSLVPPAPSDMSDLIMHRVVASAGASRSVNWRRLLPKFGGIAAAAAVLIVALATVHGPAASPASTSFTLDDSGTSTVHGVITYSSSSHEVTVTLAGPTTAEGRPNYAVSLYEGEHLISAFRPSPSSSGSVSWTAAGIPDSTKNLGVYYDPAPPRQGVTPMPIPIAKQCVAHDSAFTCVVVAGRGGEETGSPHSSGGKSPGSDKGFSGVYGKSGMSRGDGGENGIAPRSR